MPAVSKLLGSLTVAAAAMAASADPAAAHTDLARSSPEAEAQLVRAPASVTLTFARPIGERFAVLTVTAGDGTSWAAGEPSVAGDTVTQPLRPLSDGTYTVGYRVVAADGHPISGTLSFDVDVPAASATAPLDGAPAAGEVLRVESAAVTTDSDGPGMLAPLGAVGIVSLLVGAGAVTARRRATAVTPSATDGRN